jgi:hypothetical protein
MLLFCCCFFGVFLGPIGGSYDSVTGVGGPNPPDYKFTILNCIICARFCGSLRNIGCSSFLKYFEGFLQETE